MFRTLVQSATRTVPNMSYIRPNQIWKRTPVGRFSTTVPPPPAPAASAAPVPPPPVAAAIPPCGKPNCAQPPGHHHGSGSSFCGNNCRPWFFALAGLAAVGAVVASRNCNGCPNCDRGCNCTWCRLCQGQKKDKNGDGKGKDQV